MKEKKTEHRFDYGDKVFFVAYKRKWLCMRERIEVPGTITLKWELADKSLPASERCGYTVQLEDRDVRLEFVPERNIIKKL